MINEYVINSLLYNDDYWNLRVVGQDEDLDILSLDFRNLQFDKNALINLIRSDRCTLSPTISIDAELLNDDDIVNALREKNIKALDDQIAKAVFGSLTAPQLEEINKILDSGEENPEVFQEFFQNAGVDLQKITSETMTKFSEQFLGGQNA